jgi:hypothetical protein
MKCAGDVMSKIVMKLILRGNILSALLFIIHKNKFNACKPTIFIT